MEDLMTIAYQKWQTALENGDFEQAQKYYHALCGSTNEPIEIAFIMGLWQRQNGLYTESLASFEHAIVTNPATTAVVLCEIGNTYAEMEQDTQAAAAYERALAIDDKWADLHFCYGQCLGRLGQKEAAKQALCRVLQLEPHTVEAFINVAVELSEMNLHDEAIHVYMQALMLEPENYYLYSNLAIEFAELNDFASALFCHYKGLLLNDTVADLWYNLACTYSLMNEVDNGLAALEKAILFDGENAFYAQEDPELTNLRRNARFYKLLNLPLGR